MKSEDLTEIKIKLAALIQTKGQSNIVLKGRKENML